MPMPRRSLFNFSNSNQYDNLKFESSGISVDDGPMVTTVSRRTIRPNDNIINASRYNNSVNAPSYNDKSVIVNTKNNNLNILYIILPILFIIILIIIICIVIYFSKKKETKI